MSHGEFGEIVVCSGVIELFLKRSHELATLCLARFLSLNT